MNTIRSKDFLPLIIAFAVISLYTGTMLSLHGSWNMLYAMRHFEAAFFIIFSLLKLLNWQGFVTAYRTYDIVAKQSKAYAYAYPLIELTLGIAYLMSYQPLLTNSITLIIMIIGTLGVTLSLIKKQKIACACMGTIFKIPMTIVTLIEDFLMGAMALIMILIIK